MIFFFFQAWNFLYALKWKMHILYSTLIKSKKSVHFNSPKYDADNFLKKIKNLANTHDFVLEN